MQRGCHQVEIIYEVLQMIWKTYHYSPKSTRELQAIGIGGECTEANTGERNKVASSHQPSTQSFDNTKFRWFWPICCGVVPYGPPKCNIKKCRHKGAGKVCKWEDEKHQVCCILSFPGRHVCNNFKVTSEDAKKWFNSFCSSVAPPWNDSQRWCLETPASPKWTFETVHEYAWGVRGSRWGAVSRPHIARVSGWHTQERKHSNW